MGSSIGKLFKLTTFGESHGSMIGGVIEGCPSGLKLNIEAIQSDLDRRRPGQSKVTTSRNESDQVQIVSGIFEGITTGSPINIDMELLEITLYPSYTLTIISSTVPSGVD